MYIYVYIYIYIYIYIYPDSPRKDHSWGCTAEMRKFTVWKAPS